MNRSKLVITYLGVLVILSACGGGGGTDSTSDVDGDELVGNEPPTINGIPSGEIREGQAYSFTPSAEDQDGDVLTYSIVNKPDWMGFDEETGSLSGVPGAEDVGHFPDINITVSDGEADASLGAFDLTVQSTSATLSWTAPVTRVDDSPLPLSELGGYKIYSGPNPDDLSLLADLSDPSATEYSHAGLEPATYYYSVTAYNIYGDESDYSDVLSKTID